MWYAIRALADWLKCSWSRPALPPQDRGLKPSSPPPGDQPPPTASISITPRAKEAILEGIVESLGRNEPYEVVRARVGAAAGFDALVSRAPRGVAYPPVIQALARASEEGFYRRAAEHDIYEQCKRVIQHQVTDGGLASAEADEWEKVAFQTVGALCMVRPPDNRLREEARCSYEEVLKAIHGSDSTPTPTREGQRVISEEREERYWDACQWLASWRTTLRADRIYEMYSLARSLEKTEPSRAIDLYSKFAAGADLSVLRGYVLSAFERMSLLHERAGEFTGAVEAIARYEKTAENGSATKNEMATIQKRKTRVLAKLARRTGPRA